MRRQPVGHGRLAGEVGGAGVLIAILRDLPEQEERRRPRSSPAEGIVVQALKLPGPETYLAAGLRAWPREWDAGRQVAVEAVHEAQKAVALAALPALVDMVRVLRTAMPRAEFEAEPKVRAALQAILRLKGLLT